MRDSNINLKSVAGLMARVGGLEQAVTGQPFDAEFKGSISMVGLGLFRLVVMGEIKKGKSSFINALCGIKSIVPVHSDVATSTVFKLRHGPELKYTVFFQDKDAEGRPQKLEISASEVNSYGTEDGNPENVKKVDFIAVEAPSAVLKDGFIVVDTPGVGGLFKKHRDITYRHAPKADAIFFVTDSIESPIGADEVKFLKDLRNATGLIYFVQTKAAQVDSEACRKRMENNISILENQVGISRSEIRYFVLDSRLKMDADESHDLDDLNDSGYPALMAYIQNRLKPDKDRNIALVGLRRSRNKLEVVRVSLQQKRRILESDSEDKIKSVTSELNVAEQGLRSWESDQARALIQEFQLAMNEINADVQTELGRHIKPSGQISEFMNEALLNASGAVSASEIYASAPILSQEARARASEALLRSSEMLQERAQKLVEALAQKAGAQLSMQLTTQVVAKPLEGFGESTLRDLVAKSQDTNYFETARTSLYGGGAGIAIASVVGAVVGSVIPVVGTAIGSYVGVIIAGAWGGFLACNIKDTKDKEMARREVLGAIDRDLGNIQTTAITELNKATFALRTKADDALRSIISDVRKKFADQRSALQARKNADQKTIQKERLILESLEREMKDVEQQQASIEQTLDKR